jgi:biotin carboxyl carrier protein
MNKLNVTVNGTVYEVILEAADSSAAPVAPVEPSVGKTADGYSITSPLSGTMVAVHVQPGQTISEGDKIFTLEAMKMNTFVCADKAGKVIAVLVKVGDSISDGQPLLELA